MSSSECWKLTLPTMRWTALPSMNVGRYAEVTVCVGNQVYVLGGYNSCKWGTLQSVECFDEHNRSWQFSCDMPSKLYGHTAVSYKHFIYVFGGDSSSNPFDKNLSRTTFMLDTIRKEWNRKADMPGDCLAGSSVVYRGRIYVLGDIQNCSLYIL